MRHARHARRGTRAELLAANLRRRAPNADAATTPTAPACPAWTLKQPPSEYLKRTPGGKHAELARQILAAEG